MSLSIDDTFSLPMIFAWLRINWGKIVLGGVVCAGLALPMALSKAKLYDSAVTLLVSPPTFKAGTISEMMPRALPVETYKVIALSAPLLAAVIHKVPLKETSVESLRERLSVELVEMGTRNAQTGVMYTKALTFHAKATEPELAATTVQVWADVFKDQVDLMAAEGAKESFTLLETLHTSTKSELEQAELALAEHMKLWNLDLIKAQLEAKQKSYTEFETDLKKAEVDLASSEMELSSLEEVLSQEPEKNVYFRAPSDDAYWIAGLENNGKSKSEPDRGLRTELQNPNYVETKTLVVEAKGKIGGLKAQKETILLKLGEIKNEMDTLTVTFADKTVERSKLTRESESLQENYKLVRAEHEKARIADQTQASDIVVAGNAVIPAVPSSLSNRKLVVVAAIGGMLLSCAFLAFREISALGLEANLAQKKPRISQETA